MPSIPIERGTTGGQPPDPRDISGKKKEGIGPLGREDTPAQKLGLCIMKLSRLPVQRLSDRCHSLLTDLRLGPGAQAGDVLAVPPKDQQGKNGT